MPNFSRCCRRRRHRRYCRRCGRRCGRRTSASILRRSVLKSNSLASGTKEGFDAVYFEEEGKSHLSSISTIYFPQLLWRVF